MPQVHWSPVRPVNQYAPTPQVHWSPVRPVNHPTVHRWLPRKMKVPGSTHPTVHRWLPRKMEVPGSTHPTVHRWKCKQQCKHTHCPTFRNHQKTRKRMPRVHLRQYAPTVHRWLPQPNPSPTSTRSVDWWTGGHLSLRVWLHTFPFPSPTPLDFCSGGHTNRGVSARCRAGPNPLPTTSPSDVLM